MTPRKVVIMEISQNIKSYRQKKGFTQKEFAELLNVSDKTISSWERERTYPDLETIIAISDLIEVSLDRLLRGDDKVVEKITKDTQLGQKRHLLRLGAGLLLLGVLFVGGWTYQRGMMVDRPNEIKSATFVSKGGGEGQLDIQLDLPFYETYQGYMMGGSSDTGEVDLEIMTGFHFFGKRTEGVEIPFDENFRGLATKEVVIRGKNNQPIYKVKNKKIAN